jgi:hypothetical protein
LLLPGGVASTGSRYDRKFLGKGMYHQHASATPQKWGEAFELFQGGAQPGALQGEG